VIVWDNVVPGWSGGPVVNTEGKVRPVIGTKIIVHKGNGLHHGKIRAVPLAEATCWRGPFGRSRARIPNMTTDRKLSCEELDRSRFVT